MEMVYLGLFERIFNQVLDRIFMPVFDFVISILNVGFAFIFNDVLAGVLLPVLEIAFEKYIIAYQFVFGTFTYEIFVKPCFSILDTVERAFDLFIGIENVIYYPNGTVGQDVLKVTDKTLLEVFFNFPTVQNAFWLITASGIGIALLLSIYGVARSALDLDFENKKPVSHVMTQLFKSIVAAFLVPFMVLLMVNLAQVVVRTLDTTVNVGNSNITENDNSSMGSALFVMCTANAAWDNEQNRSTRRIKTTGNGIKLEVYDEINENFDLMDFPRNLFYANNEHYNYRNSVMVWKYFNPGKFDYFGFYTGIFVLVIMVICLITLIKRLFELVILYMVSPYFVAMMPLDDGEKFREWFSMFLGKLFTGYGSLVALKVYLMLMPVFMRGGIRLPNSSVSTSDILYYVFAIGGAWSVYKSSSLLTNMINASAGRSEEQSMAASAGAMAMLTVRPVQNMASKIQNKMENKFINEPVSKLNSSLKESLSKGGSGSGGSSSKKPLQPASGRNGKKPEKKHSMDRLNWEIYEKRIEKKGKAFLKKEAAKKKADARKKAAEEKKSEAAKKKAEKTGNKIDIPPMADGYGSGYGGGSESASAGSAGSKGSSAASGTTQSRVSDPASRLKEKLSDQRIKGQEDNRGDKK